MNNDCKYPMLNIRIKKLINYLCLILIFSFATGIASAAKFNASFNCDKAAATIELLICKEKSLADADIEVSKAYKAAKGRINKDKKSKLLKEQRKWLKRRFSQCKIKKKLSRIEKNYLLDKKIKSGPHDFIGDFAVATNCLVTLLKDRAADLNVLTNAGYQYFAMENYTVGHWTYLLNTDEVFDRCSSERNVFRIQQLKNMRTINYSCRMEKPAKREADAFSEGLNIGVEHVKTVAYDGDQYFLLNYEWLGRGRSDPNFMLYAKLKNGTHGLVVSGSGSLTVKTGSKPPVFSAFTYIEGDKYTESFRNRKTVKAEVEFTISNNSMKLRKREIEIIEVK